ncbi:hypothetical protein cyc_05777 [Cyclospora cayetanensis]|uniref:Uncharacterized protein n=1 Tax=Cyclospora cayetanensis TaxID=88456 RepID=A0A1D3D652_9EIME|nr:hypothetical protein cyc_05777 [Cyclospora cayetanensis]
MRRWKAAAAAATTAPQGAPLQPPTAPTSCHSPLMQQQRQLRAHAIPDPRNVARLRYEGSVDPAAALPPWQRPHARRGAASAFHPKEFRRRASKHAERHLLRGDPPSRGRRAALLAAPSQAAQESKMPFPSRSLRQTGVSAEQRLRSSGVAKRKDIRPPWAGRDGYRGRSRLAPAASQQRSRARRCDLARFLCFFPFFSRDAWPPSASAVDSLFGEPPRLAAALLRAATLLAPCAGFFPCLPDLQPLPSRPSNRHASARSSPFPQAPVASSLPPNTSPRLVQPSMRPLAEFSRAKKRPQAPTQETQSAVKREHHTRECQVLAAAAPLRRRSRDVGRALRSPGNEQVFLLVSWQEADKDHGGNPLDNSHARQRHLPVSLPKSSVAAAPPRNCAARLGPLGCWFSGKGLNYRLVYFSEIPPFRHTLRNTGSIVGDASENSSGGNLAAARSADGQEGGNGSVLDRGKLESSARATTFHM